MLIMPSIHVYGGNGSILQDSGSVSDNSEDPVRALSESVAGSSVSFLYRYDAVKGKGHMTGAGSAILQGSAYLIDVDGLKFFCDGSTKWTVDYNTREVVIETADSEADDCFSNPVLLLVSADTMFEQYSAEQVDFNGSNALRVNMRPKSGCGLESVSLYFRRDVLVGACAVSEDGTETNLIISGFCKSEKKDLSYFMFDDKSLDSSWIVTDLR